MLKVQNIYHGKFLLFQMSNVKEYTLELKRYTLMKSITDIKLTYTRTVQNIRLSQLGHFAKCLSKVNNLLDSKE